MAKEKVSGQASSDVVVETPDQIIARENAMYSKVLDSGTGLLRNLTDTTIGIDGEPASLPDGITIGYREYSVQEVADKTARKYANAGLRVALQTVVRKMIVKAYSIQNPTAGVATTRRANSATPVAYNGTVDGLL